MFSHKNLPDRYLHFKFLLCKVMEFEITFHDSGSIYVVIAEDVTSIPTEERAEEPKNNSSWNHLF